MAEYSHRFFSNRACAYYPCHQGADSEEFNCLFCYCPLYRYKDCGGTPAWRENGVKDCTGCLFPHHPESYDTLVARLKKTATPCDEHTE